MILYIMKPGIPAMIKRNSGIGVCRLTWWPRSSTWMTWDEKNRWFPVKMFPKISSPKWIIVWRVDLEISSKYHRSNILETRNLSILFGCWVTHPLILSATKKKYGRFTGVHGLHVFYSLRDVGMAGTEDSRHSQDGKRLAHAGPTWELVQLIVLSCAEGELEG